MQIFLEEKCYFCILETYRYITSMARHNRLGTEGEEFAVQFLIKQGLIVRERNWRFLHWEIDIVAEEADAIHVVEVKTRTSDEHFNPMQSITRKKISNLIHAGNAYLHYHNIKKSLQFDVIIVIGQSGNFSLQYLPNSIRPPLRTYR